MIFSGTTFAPRSRREDRIAIRFGRGFSRRCASPRLLDQCRNCLATRSPVRDRRRNRLTRNPANCPRYRRGCAANFSAAFLPRFHSSPSEMGRVSREIWPLIRFDLSFFSSRILCGEQDTGNGRGTADRSTCHLFRCRFSDPTAVFLNLQPRSPYLRACGGGDKWNIGVGTREVTRSHERKPLEVTALAECYRCPDRSVPRHQVTLPRLHSRSIA